jgi:signal transduction histidine kinase
LADRVAQLGGTLSVGNQPERGVLLTAEIPLAVPA